jgi:hypothetical protein
MSDGPVFVTLSPRVDILTTADPDPAQVAAWQRLWARLLRPTNSNAPAVEAEASGDGTDRVTRGTEEQNGRDDKITS